MNGERHTFITVASGALAETFKPLVGDSQALSYYLKEIRVHLGASPGSENITLTLDSAAGAVYDCEIYSKDLNGLTSWVYQWPVPAAIKAGDELDIAYTNTVDTAIGIELIWNTESENI